jgi:predicted site-specific integrase-resolvase
MTNNEASASGAKEGEVMNAQEVCKALDISYMTLLRRVKEGVLTPLPKSPGLKRHRRLQFHRADVERLLQS